MRAWIELNWLTMGSMAVSCEYGNESLCFGKGKEIPELEGEMHVKIAGFEIDNRTLGISNTIQEY
jgi:hypothetical protein